MTIVLKRNNPLKKVQVQDLHRQSGNFSTHLVSRLTGLNTANQNHLNELRWFQFKYFVQWPRVFLTSNLSGRHITKKNPAIFPYYKTFRTLFFFETSLKKKKKHRDVIVKTVETSSQTGIVEMFEKHWQCCETLREIS